jgi:hypothetical protein
MRFAEIAVSVAGVIAARPDGVAFGGSDKILIGRNRPPPDDIRSNRLTSTRWGCSAMAKTKKAGNKRQRNKRSTVRRSTAAPPRGPTRAAIRGFVAAAGRGDLAAVQAVLAKLPQLAREPEALFEAAANGHAAVVRCLLDGGADANAISQDEHRCRLLHRVIQHSDDALTTPDQLDVVKVLLEHGGADAGARGTLLNVSAIAFAAMTGRRQFLPLLLPYLERWDIFTAAVLGEARHVATILQRNPEQAKAIDQPNGMTALDYATASRLGAGNTEVSEDLQRIAQLLIESGATPGAPAAKPTASVAVNSLAKAA